MRLILLIGSDGSKIYVNPDTVVLVTAALERGAPILNTTMVIFTGALPAMAVRGNPDAVAQALGVL